MMLPEHKQAILQHRSELEHREMPLLDEQRIEELSCLAAEAVQKQSLVRVEVYRPDQNEIVAGQIRKIDAAHGRMEIVNQDGSVRIPLKEVLDIAHVSKDCK